MSQEADIAFLQKSVDKLEKDYSELLSTTRIINGDIVALKGGEIASLRKDITTLLSDFKDITEKAHERERKAAKWDGIKTTLTVILPALSVAACIWMGVATWNDLPNKIQAQVNDKVGKTVTADLEKAASMAKENTLRAEKEAGIALKSIKDSQEKQAKELRLITKEEYDQEIAKIHNALGDLSAHDTRDDARVDRLSGDITKVATDVAHCIKIDQEVVMRTNNEYIPNSFIVLQTEPDHDNKSFFLFDRAVRDDHHKRSFYFTPYSDVIK